MSTENILAISPLDGRYKNKLNTLDHHVSEFALFKCRLKVELSWLIALCNQEQIADIPPLTPQQEEKILSIYADFSVQEAQKVKDIEKKTNHDIKALEYYIHVKLKEDDSLQALRPLVHFCATSADINNLAYALMQKDCRDDFIIPQLNHINEQLQTMITAYQDTPMLSRTHGQAATPTTLGKELSVFKSRIRSQLENLKNIPIMGKFNGATGNFNAHHSTYPDVDWLKVCQLFIESLGLQHNPLTTQIEPHDHLAQFLDNLCRINTILVDLSRDIWGYISLGYFTQIKVEGEVGSSTMPHKVNPIDFENAEGNLGIANALAQHLSSKLPISRWQRDLSNSTALRNLGSVFGYCLVAYTSLQKGLRKIHANHAHIKEDLQEHWELLAEPIQTTLKRYGVQTAYEDLKNLTRGETLDQQQIHQFINALNIPDEAKQRLLALTPENYIGYAQVLCDIGE